MHPVYIFVRGVDNMPFLRCLGCKEMDAIHILLQAFFQLVLSNSMGLVYTLKEISHLIDMIDSTQLAGRCLLWLGFAL